MAFFFLQNVKNNSYWEKITFVCVAVLIWFICEYLRSNISWRSNMHIDVIRILCKLRQSEIDDFEMLHWAAVIWREHNVLRFEIPVHDS